MKRWLVLALGLTTCGTAAPVRTSTALPLHVFSPELPADLEVQAMAALERDAWRREARFRDAEAPGYLFAATRVDQRELEAGLFTPAETYELGAQLFDVVPTAAEGFGSAERPGLVRFEVGVRGGPDATHCAQCHWRGGPAGAGDASDDAYLQSDGDSQASGLARNPRPLVGDGYVEILAGELSADLGRQRDDLVAAARDHGQTLRTELVAKGVSYGKLAAAPDGTLDPSGLTGIDADLVVKPFGWKGTQATLRDAVEDALLLHLGLESTQLVATAPPERVGRAGGADPDGDGVTDEITEGQVSALTAFVAMQELPEVAMPTRQDMLAMWSTGRERFDALGCAACHVPSMPLAGTTWVLPSREGGEPIAIDLALDGGEPRIAAAPVALFLFSDLRRHHMGAGLAEAKDDRGVPADVFLTPPLWGLARSRPYLHDGRAPTVEAAVLDHGGEAQAARDAYAALSEHDRYPLRLYLATLDRAPRMMSP
jgi:mono/diheme cytochrome c family protein